MNDTNSFHFNKERINLTYYSMKFYVIKLIARDILNLKYCK